MCQLLNLLHSEWQKLHILSVIGLKEQTIFVEPACGERDKVVTILVRCMCVCPSRFVPAITLTFMHEFQNDLAQLFSLRSRNAFETFF